MTYAFFKANIDWARESLLAAQRSVEQAIDGGAPADAARQMGIAQSHITLARDNLLTAGGLLYLHERSKKKKEGDAWRGESMIQIRTDRGLVRVLDAKCEYRPCLHVHWSNHADSKTKIDKRTGGAIRTFPLVCMHNEQYGCPDPLPDPVKP